MQRRDFLKTSVALSAMAGFAVSPQSATAAEPAAKGREFYELRYYRLKEATDYALLMNYLGKAALPALNRLGIRPIGVFKDTDPKEAPGVYVLIPYPTAEAFAGAAEQVNADAEYQKAAADYLHLAKTNPAFLRIDSWLLRAFAGLPQLSLPSYSKEKKARIFELRTYESYSEAKAQTKVDMFNDGEIQTMQEVGLAPVFYGQTLVGRDLPHLIYMVSAENRDLHKAHWGVFGGHPTWKRLSSDPKYADTVSKITNRFLEPADCSQI